MSRDTEEEDNWDNLSNQGNEPDEAKQSIVDELYNTDARVEAFVRKIDGSNGKDALAGQNFINKQSAALKSIINTTNSFSKITYDEARAVLHRAVKAFIYDMLNDRTVRREHYETLTYAYWHQIELFLGLTINGHGANVLKDALAGLNTQFREEQPKKEGWFEWAKRNA